MDLANTTDVVFWDIPSPCRDGIPFSDRDLHIRVGRDCGQGQINTAGSVLGSLCCDGLLCHICVELVNDKAVYVVIYLSPGTPIRIG